MDASKLDELLKSSYSEFNRLTSSHISTIDTPQSIFEIFFKKCQQLWEPGKRSTNSLQKSSSEKRGYGGLSPPHTLQEMKTMQSTKAKGDIFELFCQRYLLTIRGYDRVWLLKELSDDLKKQLKLPMGDKD